MIAGTNCNLNESANSPIFLKGLGPRRVSFQLPIKALREKSEHITMNPSLIKKEI